MNLSYRPTPFSVPREGIDVDVVDQVGAFRILGGEGDTGHPFVAAAARYGYEGRSAFQRPPGPAGGEGSVGGELVVRVVFVGREDLLGFRVGARGLGG